VRSIKNGPIVGAVAAFQPDQIKGALPTNGQSQFLATLDRGSGFPCTGLRGVHPAVSRRVSTSSLDELPEDPVPVATCERLRGRETAIDSETFETPMCYPPLGGRMKAESYSRA